MKAVELTLRAEEPREIEAPHRESEGDEFGKQVDQALARDTAQSDDKPDDEPDDEVPAEAHTALALELERPPERPLSFVLALPDLGDVPRMPGGEGEGKSDELALATTAPLPQALTRMMDGVQTARDTEHAIDDPEASGNATAAIAASMTSSTPAHSQPPTATHAAASSEGVVHIDDPAELLEIAEALKPPPVGGTTLELDLGDLGRVQLRVEPEGDAIRIALRTDDPAAAAFLNQRKTELLDAVSSSEGAMQIDVEVGHGGHRPPAPRPDDDLGDASAPERSSTGAPPDAARVRRYASIGTTGLVDIVV